MGIEIWAWSGLIYRPGVAREAVDESGFPQDVWLSQTTHNNMPTGVYSPRGVWSATFGRHGSLSQWIRTLESAVGQARRLRDRWAPIIEHDDTYSGVHVEMIEGVVSDAVAEDQLEALLLNVGRRDGVDREEFVEFWRKYATIKAAFVFASAGDGAVHFA